MKTPKEQSKIECGKRYFKELGSEMVVATSIRYVN
jgi:restriction endonuclease